MKIVNRKSVTLFIIAILFAVSFYHLKKSLPVGLNMTGPPRTIPVQSVTFLADRTYLNEAGERQTDQEIFDEVINMIRQAQNYILIDMFLYNAWQGSSPENTRQLSEEVTRALIEQKLANPDMIINVISDPINTAYRGDVSPHFTALRENGIDVTITNLLSLRDSNPSYSSFWRVFIRWAGNDFTSRRLMPHPFQADGPHVTFRSWLSLLNFKANHRKLIIADQPQADGTLKLATLVTSANPHDGSSAHGNIAVKVSDSLWRDGMASEQAVASFSGRQNITFQGTEIDDQSGSVTAQLLTEGAIKDKIIELINQTGPEDTIDIAMFYFSERDIIKSLIAASGRGVSIRLVLDANKDAFGHEKIGVPNRPVAHELLSRTNNQVKIRWCLTHGEQCHSKLLLIKTGPTYNLIAGSANLTKRNIGNYNLETDVLIQADEVIPALQAANDYFDEIWENREGKTYTADYEQFADPAQFKKVIYRLQEKTGLSSF